MPNVICRLCGAEAISKCPYCRSVFPEDQHEAMMSYLLKFKVKKDDQTGANWLEVSWYMGDGEKRNNELWALEALRDALISLDLKRYSCDHDWIFKEGEHSTIGCGHG